MSSNARTLEGLHQDIQDKPFMFLQDDEISTIKDALEGNYDLDNLHQIFQNNLDRIQAQYPNLTNKDDPTPEDQLKAQRQLENFYQRQWNNLLDNIERMAERQSYMAHMRDQANPKNTPENAFYGNDDWENGHGNFSNRKFREFQEKPTENTMLKSGQMGISGSLADGDLSVKLDHKAGATRAEVMNDNKAAIRALTAAGCDKIQLENANVESAAELKELIREVYRSCDNPKKIALGDTPIHGGKYYISQKDIDELYDQRQSLRAERTGGSTFNREAFQNERRVFQADENNNFRMRGRPEASAQAGIGANGGQAQTTTPAGQEGNPAPTAGQEGNPAPAAGQEGNPAPTAGQEGNPAPTAGQEGNPAPAAGQEGNPAPAAGQEGNPAPAAGQEGNPAPAAGQQGNSAATPAGPGPAGRVNYGKISYPEAPRRPLPNSGAVPQYDQPRPGRSH